MAIVFRLVSIIFGFYLLSASGFLLETTRSASREHRAFIPEDANITVNLSITYDAPAINFTSCCKQYNYLSEVLNLNTLGDQIARAAEVRNDVKPSITWNTDGKLYTLLVIDPDNVEPVGTESKPFLHYQVLNIPDGHVDHGNKILDYIGPVPPGGVTHAIYFLLYRQQANIDPSVAKTYAGMFCGPNIGRCLYDITKFTKDNKLQLVGLRRMKVKTDPYVRYVWTTTFGASEDQQCEGVLGYSNPCAAVQERPFLPITTGMTTVINVKYHAPAINFTSCCKTYSYPETSLDLNNVPDDGIVDSADIRTGLQPTITFGHGHSDGMFSLLMVDPINFPSVSTEDKPILHYQVLNIHDGDSGNETMSYIGPIVPDVVNHTLYFLLYQHNHSIDPNSVGTYAGQNCGPNAGRCFYDVNKFVKDNNLKLVGVKRVTVGTDPFMRYVWTNIYKSPAEQQCKNVPGFSDPCQAVQEMPFLPRNDTGMVLSLDITLRTSNISFTSCCTTYSFSKSSLKLKDLDDSTVNSVLVRTGQVPDITWGQGHVGGKLYTLMIIDPDINYPTGSASKPFLHYQVVNIRHQRIQDGNETMKYLGPVPFSTKQHNIYFLLYQQDGYIIPTSTKSHAGLNCAGRCNYDINRFVALNNLKLVAYDKMKIQTDPYVRFVWTTVFGGPTEQFCHNVRGYGNPCPTKNIPVIPITIG